MSRLLSQIFSGDGSGSGGGSSLGLGLGLSSFKHQPPEQPFGVLVIRPSPQDPNLKLVHPAAYPIDAPPLYTIILTGESLSLFRSTLNPTSAIGNAQVSIRVASFEARLSLHGAQLPVMKKSEMSGDFKLEWPPTVPLKWISSSSGGSGMTLVDSFGIRLARYKPGGMFSSGEKGFEILVPCDQSLVDLVVLSAMAARMATKKENETTTEVVSAVMG